MWLGAPAVFPLSLFIPLGGCQLLDLDQKLKTWELIQSNISIRFEMYFSDTGLMVLIHITDPHWTEHLVGIGTHVWELC